ncbi:MAG: hypothetical protein WAS21_17505 [Geminicoccaceae bacterium]
MGAYLGSRAFAGVALIAAEFMADSAWAQPEVTAIYWVVPTPHALLEI